MLQLSGFCVTIGSFWRDTKVRTVRLVASKSQSPEL